MRISLFIPCFVDQFFPQIGIAIVEQLERLGHDVDYPEDQTCCGQPAFSAGFRDEARAVALSFMHAFRDADLIVVPSGSCATMLKVSYRELFRDTRHLEPALALGEKTWEYSEFLVHKLGALDLDARFPARVTFHDGCHGLRELGIRDAPRTLLQHVRDLELVEMGDTETCCGFGGIFAVQYPQISTSMAEVRCASITGSRAEYVVSNDPSCLLHLKGYIDRQGLPIRCLHLSEVLSQR